MPNTRKLLQDKEMEFDGAGAAIFYPLFVRFSFSTATSTIPSFRVGGKNLLAEYIHTGLHYKAVLGLRECCRPVEEVVGNSRNKIHQTWELLYSGAFYLRNRRNGRRLA